ncbi:putative 2-aminoethylphosphonate ABC transporter substrate-binding protein [Parendozoicomonas haliclonae]|uniref:Putative binding protein component of ABC iron transporter n=1 Tax=Parendozoicomonas haliclonae TaxID=1960125 RepID=A0A1X7APR7_9GAMM|nr:putative 2-aminoethylphosphonate ABC transporter substrate-binding protein [Parendozoicomonas haliclonae]SMA50286.1 putative binding protein component of ABC iron transporter precursor [Parendozoicomonas haliclonae]
MGYKTVLKGLLPLAATVLSTGAFAGKTELTVYTAFEADQLKEYEKSFESAHPDIDIRWVRDSTGIVTAKLLAEKNNPKADVVWGLAATSLMLLKQEGMLQPYKPQGVEKLRKSFVDNAATPSWVGAEAWVASICYNTVEGEKNNVPAPASWKDLTKPVYKGHVIMPNPNSSGTGFLDVSSWIQMFGEENAWAYMDGLHQNISRYTHSGSKPCKLAASGETTIGISFAYRGAKSKKKGAPLEIITPTEGLGWDLEATAIIKGTDKLEAAQKLMDWSITREANTMYNKYYAVVGIPSVEKQVPFYPENIGKKMIDNNFEWAASNRQAILAEWQNRYDGKSDPK